TKATTGHDVNLSEAEAAELVGGKTLAAAAELCLAAYARAARRAEETGIIVADTKLELGRIDGELVICDEVLTPDSSRFWPAESWMPGATPPSFDKQPVRDWLEGTGWDKTPPAPHLPPEVVAATSERYVRAYEQLSGRRLADWPGAAPGARA
ncbi:MAG: phosphoribosylaminoimidazolesuccinocarboxamide synthase, partial [Acidimicrobiales bacterium]